MGDHRGVARIHRGADPCGSEVSTGRAIRGRWAIYRFLGHGNHEPTANDPPELKFGLVHEVEILPGGLPERILGPGRVTVNPAHGKGVKQLAPALKIEALALDGVIEAITLPTAPGFNLGVQWHPEWQAAGTPVSKAIFRAFGDASRAYRNQRPRQPRPSPTRGGGSHGRWSSR